MRTLRYSLLSKYYNLHSTLFKPDPIGQPFHTHDAQHHLRCEGYHAVSAVSYPDRARNNLAGIEEISSLGWVSLQDVWGHDLVGGETCLIISYAMRMYRRGAGSNGAVFRGGHSS